MSQSDLELLRDPGEWPIRPILPVIGRHDERRGVIHEENLTRVYDVNIWALKEGTMLKDLHFLDYTRTEDLLQEWAPEVLTTSDVD